MSKQWQGADLTVGEGKKPVPQDAQVRAHIQKWRDRVAAQSHIVPEGFTKLTPEEVNAEWARLAADMEQIYVRASQLIRRYGKDPDYAIPAEEIKLFLPIMKAAGLL